MDSVLMIVALSLVALVVILFFELRGAQRRMEDMRDELESRLRRSLLDVAEPVARIPGLEERLMQVEREVAEQQYASAAVTAVTAVTAATPAPPAAETTPPLAA